MKDTIKRLWDERLAQLRERDKPHKGSSAWERLANQGVLHALVEAVFAEAVRREHDPAFIAGMVVDEAVNVARQQGSDEALRDHNRPGPGKRP